MDQNLDESLLGNQRQNQPVLNAVFPSCPVSEISDDRDHDVSCIGNGITTKVALLDTEGENGDNGNRNNSSSVVGKRRRTGSYDDVLDLDVDESKRLKSTIDANEICCNASVSVNVDDDVGVSICSPMINAPDVGRIIGEKLCDQKQAEGHNQATPSRNHEEKWQMRLAELKAYKEKYGNTLVPKSYKANPQLSKWVKMQRFQYKLLQEGKPSRLKKERLEALEEIEFCWIVRSRKVAWDVRFQELIEFKKLTNNCLVPMRNSENPQLGRWVEVQRKERKKWMKGEKSSITAEHIQKLDSLGFVWSLNCEWDVRFQELKDYKERNGHCLVPRSYPPNQKLAYWIGHQRKECVKRKHNKKTRLSDERINALNSIGFCWDASAGVSWNQRWAELMKYKEEHGDFVIEKDQNPELYRWCVLMRREYGNFVQGKKSRLSIKRIKEMESMGYIWNFQEGMNEREQKNNSEPNVEDEMAIVTAAALKATIPEHDHQLSQIVAPTDMDLSVQHTYDMLASDTKINGKQPGIQSTDHVPRLSSINDTRSLYFVGSRNSSLFHHNDKEFEEHLEQI